MATAYSDAAFEQALMKLRARHSHGTAGAPGHPKETLLQKIRKAVSASEEEGRSESSLHDIAALLRDTGMSGLEFEPATDDRDGQEAGTPWGFQAAYALVQVIGGADLTPVRAATQLCEVLRGELDAALRVCKSDLSKVNAELDLEDRRIAQISAASAARKSSRLRSGPNDLGLLRARVDQFDQAERRLLVAADAFDPYNAEIAEYLFIGSALRAALEIVGPVPLQQGDEAARVELDRLRVAVENVDGALKRTDVLVEAENAARVSAA